MAEWNASEYAKHASLQEAMAAEVLATLHLDGNERVLDVGCGNGKITAEIADRLPHGSIIGVDASQQMIDFASSHFGAAGEKKHANLSFEVADARQLPFDEQFDLVVSFNALHWVPDQITALRSIFNALRPGGRAHVRLVPRGERKSLENVLEETRKSPRWAEYFAGFTDPYLHLTEEEYARLAEEAGFKVTSLEVSDKAWNFKSSDAFFALLIVTCIAWTKQLPEELRPDFVRDLMHRYQAVACTAPGEENYFRFYQMDIDLLRP